MPLQRRRLEHVQRQQTAAMPVFLSSFVAGPPAPFAGQGRCPRVLLLPIVLAITSLSAAPLFRRRCERAERHEGAAGGGAEQPEQAHVQAAEQGPFSQQGRAEDHCARKRAHSAAGLLNAGAACAGSTCPLARLPACPLACLPACPCPVRLQRGCVSRDTAPPCLLTWLACCRRCRTS